MTDECRHRCDQEAVSGDLWRRSQPWWMWTAGRSMRPDQDGLGLWSVLETLCTCHFPTRRWGGSNHQSSPTPYHAETQAPALVHPHRRIPDPARLLYRAVPSPHRLTYIAIHSSRNNPDHLRYVEPTHIITVSTPRSHIPQHPYDVGDRQYRRLRYMHHHPLIAFMAIRIQCLLPRRFVDIYAHRVARPSSSCGRGQEARVIRISTVLSRAMWKAERQTKRWCTEQEVMSSV